MEGVLEGARQAGFGTAPIQSERAMAGWDNSDPMWWIAVDMAFGLLHSAHPSEPYAFQRLGRGENVEFDIFYGTDHYAPQPIKDEVARGETRNAMERMYMRRIGFIRRERPDAVLLDVAVDHFLQFHELVKYLQRQLGPTAAESVAGLPTFIRE